METLPLLASAVIVSFFLFKNYRKFRYITPTFFAIAFSSIFFIIYPTLIIFFEPIGMGFYLSTPQSLSSHYLTANLLILIFYAAFFFGNKLAIKKLQFLPTGRDSEKRTKHIILICAIIGIASSLTFIALAGGLDYVTSNISQIRSGRDENKTYLGAFIRLFSAFLLLSLFAVAYKSIGVKGRFFSHFKLNKYSLGFIVFILLAIVVKFLEGGRGGLITVLLGCLFVYVIKQRKLPPFKHLALSFSVAILIVVYGKSIFFQIFSDTPPIMRGVGSDGYIIEFYNNFSYAYQSLLVTLEENLLGARAYTDLYNWALKPLKLMGYSPPESIAFFNTYHLIGIYESEIPPAIVAFLLQEGGIPFLLVGSIIVGVIFNLLDNILNPTTTRYSTAIVASLYATLIFLSPRILINSDPAIIAMAFIPFLGMLLFLRFALKLKLKKINRPLSQITNNTQSLDTQRVKTAP